MYNFPCRIACMVFLDYNREKTEGALSNGKISSNGASANPA
ncbi:hypothetical protein TMUPMC115_0184 [Tetragenococcus muriaticus PMC-11-5]|uniref:Uncharacterized protein n=1 Tax=Tetragenococcus muriaticus PMC-11-5 TaxID=1302649 RepID=A0A091CAG9_9ENTE|nr:hypothetical protein [Tetragenococcus muriaticus]KFN93587.1 hypothetical protein TMUPMC115_0184 [Tetragenococcus muriaticus PMC-11-5]